MACSCRTRKSAGTPASGVVARPENRVLAQAPAVDTAAYDAFVLHEVKPGESCIFCAEKHLSMASALLAEGDRQLPAAIGELELARRHTMLEYRPVCRQLAALETDACLRRLDAVRARLRHVQASVEAVVSSADSSASSDGMQLQLEDMPRTVANPFVGELHLCAAYRLAFEVGYMVPNRAMIIGDLALAREHLSRFDPDIMDRLRELRHRVQTIKASDLNIYWPYVCSGIARLVDGSLDAFREEYGDGLRDYLRV